MWRASATLRGNMRFYNYTAIVAGLLLGTACAFSQTGGTALPSPASSMAVTADALLTAQPAAARAHWGVSVVDAATGAILYARNDAQLFEPASNAKLFTTSAALALLGPSYTMGTRVVAEGTVDAAGTLHGDLRLIGGADPTLSGRAYPYAGRTDRPNPPLGALDGLAAQVLASGVRAVNGPVIADDTLFTDERYGAGWGWDDLQWEYGAAVSALPVNDDVRYLTVVPGQLAGAPVEASWLPDVPGPASGLAITAVTSAAGSVPALGLARVPDGGGLRIYGSLPAGGVGAHLALALDDPARFAGQAFRAALVTQGVAVSGGASVAHRAPEDTQSFTVETHQPLILRTLPAGSGSLGESPAGRVLATRQSAPLSDIVTVTNKVSQNLHAELLLRLLGRAEGADGSAAQGARVVRAWATTQTGVQGDDFLLYDGSGLSTRDLVTPRSLTALLRYSTTQPWGPTLRSSLPASGVDGTLASRFPALRGRVQAKTGTLGEVDALSGFLTANSGRLVIFSILCNDYPGPGSRAVIDALVLAVASNF
jgi:D-alanyl-D-alanine carboxypeptidase/D-alanyl-D-alanine-endopeptidase (penicillin-binding protein 4)